MTAGARSADAASMTTVGEVLSLLLSCLFSMLGAYAGWYLYGWVLKKLKDQERDG